MFIGSVAHINVCKKELVQYVHILASLGVPLEDSPKGGFMIYHNSESCLVVEVKSKQHLDHLLKELKEHLGHVVSSDGIKVNPKKMKAVKN